MITIESKMLKAAALFQAKGDVRYYLNGIHLNKNGRIEATDGHTAFYSDQSALKDIERSIIIRFTAAIPAKSGAAYIQVIDESKGIISFEKNETLIAFTIIKGRFPDFDRIIPKEEDGAPVKKIGINPNYMMKLQKAYSVLGGNREGASLVFFGKNSVMMATIGGFDCKSVVLIMPIRDQ